MREHRFNIDNVFLRGIKDMAKAEHGKNKIKKDTSAIKLFFMSLPAVILIIVFNYIPAGEYIIAFKDYKIGRGIIGSDWAGLENFRLLFENIHFNKILLNTVLYNSAFFVVVNVAGLGAATLLFRLKNLHIKGFFRAVLVLPYVISWVFAGEIVYALFSNDSGIINQVIGFFGGEKVLWYNTPAVWPVIITLAFAWKNAGVCSVVYYAALQGIDHGMTEAAELDGAGEFRIFSDIILPQILPAVFLIALINISGIFKSDYEMFTQLTRESGGIFGTTDVLDTYFRRGMQTTDLSFSAAAGLLQSAAGCLAAFFVLCLARRENNRFRRDIF